MDGNGRWAKERGFDRLRGHREGAKRVDEIVTHCGKIGIKYLTLYAFSTENWKRPLREINLLMSLLVQHLKTTDKKLIKNRVSLRAQGELHRLPKHVQKELFRVIEITSTYEPILTTVISLSYGGREEILNAVKNIASQVLNKKCDISNIDENFFRKYLYQPNIPYPDLLIRTSGEKRISNFLLWQIAYSELYFTDVKWPDFTPNELDKAIEEYHKRERRFGKISEQLITTNEHNVIKNN